jgi:hypothetical protein
MAKRTCSSTTSHKSNLWSVSFVDDSKNIHFSLHFNYLSYSKIYRDVINQMLNEANNSHPNIKLVRQLGTIVSFLDVLLKNQNEQHQSIKKKLLNHITYHSNLIILDMFLIILLKELYCAPCVTHLHFRSLMKNDVQ